MNLIVEAEGGLPSTTFKALIKISYFSYINLTIYIIGLSYKLLMVKVQSRKTRSKGKEYNQLWIGLPSTLCKAMRINEGDDLDVYIEHGALVLRKV